jgi:hypothetical protein
VTATVVSTPVVSNTVTTTSTLSTTLPANTVTSASVTRTQTITKTPARVTTTSTKNLLTVKKTLYTVNVKPVTKTATASCKIPTKPSKYDPIAKIRPTVGPLAHLFAEVEGLVDDVTNVLGGGLLGRDIEQEKEHFVEARAARLALVGRAPDPQPLIVTDTNTDDWTTTTTTSTAPATTAFVTSSYLLFSHSEGNANKLCSRGHDYLHHHPCSDHCAQGQDHCCTRCEYLAYSCIRYHR